MKFSANIFFILLTASVWAQQSDTTKVSLPDTVKKSFIPTGLRFGSDVVSLVQSSTDESFSGWEANADVDFYRYYVVIDIGHSERNFTSETDEYSNAGDYKRVGVDVNFLKNDPDRNMLFFGARYGWGTFSETLQITSTDPLYGTTVETFSNQDANAHWFELTSGIRVKMWKFFWMGYTIRYKFGLRTKETGDLIPWDVPGYGSTNKETAWGFNYVLMFRIPFRN